MNFNSNPVSLNANQKKVYDFLADFNNFEQLMPDQVTNWQSDKETCSFTIEGMADIKLKYAAKEPFNTIKVEPEGKSPIKFDLTLNLEADTLDEQKTIGTIVINAALNPMLAMMAKRPLENLVDVMSEKLNGLFG
jgi:carbon monoxide dehydrogenase subunit G